MDILNLDANYMMAAMKSKWSHPMMQETRQNIPLQSHKVKRVKSVDPVVIATIVALIAGAILLFVKSPAIGSQKQTKSENKTDSFTPDTLELNTVEQKKRKLPKIEKKEWVW